jgi:hypothetical protein
VASPELLDRCKVPIPAGVRALSASDWTVDQSAVVTGVDRQGELRKDNHTPQLKNYSYCLQEQKTEKA